MKKKMLILLTMIILIHSAEVYAIHGSVETNRSTGTSIKVCPRGEACRTYTTPHATITMNGKKYEAYCLDPGLHTTHTVDCEELPDAGLQYIYSHKDEMAHTGVDFKEGFIMGLRMYAMYSSNGELPLVYAGGSTPVKRAIEQAVLQFTFEKDKYGSDSGAWLNIISSNVHNGKLQMSQGISLAYNARVYKANGYIGHTAKGGSLNLGSKSIAGTRVTYSLTSNATMDRNNLRFGCENCTVDNSSLKWDGTSGSISIVVQDCSKEYKIGVSAPGGGEITTSTHPENLDFSLYGSASKSAKPYFCRSKNGSSTQNFIIFDEDEAEGMVWKTDKIPCDDPNCCTENPITPGKIIGDINNCCTDGSTSKASEYKLDELFCNPNNADIYKSKCQNQYYQDETLQSKYCKLYCTERVEIEQPGAITATSGRYFTLTKTSAGTTSPHIMAYRRCRVTTDYKQWEKDYGDQVDLEVKYYNEYQEAIAYKTMLDRASVSHPSGSCNSRKETGKTYDCHCDEDGRNCSQCKETVPCTNNYSFDSYSFPSINYYTVQINDTARKNHTAYQIINAGSGTASSGMRWANLQQSDSSCCRPSGDYSYNHSAALSSAQSRVSAAQTNYNNAAKKAKQLEQELDKCQNYFTEYQGKSADNFKMNTQMSFYYTQVYMDNTGELILDKQSINFKETPGCKIQPTGTNSKGETIYAKVGPEAGEDDLKDRRYSTIYGRETQFMRDFKETTLSLVGRGGHTAFIDTEYKANKAFSHDAKYTADCRWDEDSNEYYTLVPSGESSETTSTINYIKHGQEYRLHLTTLDGTYQTYWQLSGIGSARPGESAGRFDEYITNEGKTCAGESADGESSLTCKLHVEYEVILTGKCNGINGTDTTNDPESCEPYKEGYNLFTFKIADPGNLFPNGTIDKKEGEYAYNWTSTAKGQAAMEEIQKRDVRSETYSNDNLTYSFILTPTDMRNIKNYNKEKNADGGYSDFNMKCDCSGSSCVKCKSNFLEELSKGNIIYDNQDHRAAGWANAQKSIDAVRQANGW